MYFVFRNQCFCLLCVSFKHFSLESVQMASVCWFPKSSVASRTFCITNRFIRTATPFKTGSAVGIAETRVECFEFNRPAFFPEISARRVCMETSGVIFFPDGYGGVHVCESTVLRGLNGAGKASRTRANARGYLFSSINSTSWTL